MSDETFRFVVIASTVVDGVVAGMVLLGRQAPHEAPSARVIGIRRLLSAALVTGMVFLLKLVPLVLAGVRRFGVIHLVYADLVVLVPLVGIALLIGSRLTVRGEKWRILTTPVRNAALASLVAIPIGIDATWIEPFRLRLETTRVAVSPRRDGSDILRIGVLADLQTARVTGYERDAVARLMALKPDIILLPGDVFQGTRQAFEANRAALRDLLGQLSAPGGVYLVLGDFDGGGEHLEEVLRSTRVRLLVDEIVRVDVGDRHVTIAGVELDFATGQAREAMDRLESGIGEGDIRILVAHRPDVALGLRPRSRIDLVVAGHTHGGQVVLPWFGPPMTLSRVPRPVAAGGLHSLAGNATYVSRGVGCERGQAPRIRFLCPPEISLLELGSRPED
jgi:predicted MPP superfamily phosphohydrolase